MELEIQLTPAPIPDQAPPPPPGAGAWVEFRGVVRGEENGQPVAVLEYEAYTAMAEREMRRILEDLARQHPCLAARVVHRVGPVPVGEVAIYVGVAGRHRAEAFAVLAAFIDRLKQDVPIWKRRAPAPNALAGLTSTPAGGPVGRTDFQSEASRVSNPTGAAAAETPCQPEVAETAVWETGATVKVGPSAATGPMPARPVSVAQVRALINALCRPLEAIRVPLGEAVGRVLREQVYAPEDQPPFDCSAMDGFAVRLDDPARTLRLVDTLRAGDWRPRVLQPGETVRVATGAALPGTGLQVIPKEDARIEGDRVTVLRRERERCIRFCGEDARAGQVLVKVGTVLSPGALALLAGVGVTQPRVTRLPRVVHLATGDEIVPPEQTPAHGQIRDSNSTLVRTFLAGWRIVPDQEHVAEAEPALRKALNRRPALPELLLISGGASVGEHDFTRRALEAAGFTIHVCRTTARPGRPLIVAQRGATLAFGLPGNPLAHFVCLHLYVRAALEAWAGQSARTGLTSGRLAADLTTGAPGRETFWPARWTLQDGAACLTPLQWNSSGDLMALATANALLRVPAGTEQLARGCPVEFLRTEVGP